MKDTTNLVLFASKYPKPVQRELDRTAIELGYKILPASIGRFRSNEHYCELYPREQAEFERNKAEITGSNVHIVMNAAADMDKTFVEAINLIETAKEYGAQSVHFILAFAPYARQDRKFDKRMTSMMGKTFPKHLKCAGADRITTFDVHSQAAEDFYAVSVGRENVRFISAVGEIRKKVAEVTGTDRCVYGAPDGGDKPQDSAQAKARHIATLAFGEDMSPERDMFFITKRHRDVNTTEVTGFKGNVADCIAVELDDMTDTGGTLKNGAEVLKQNGAKKVIAAVTHGIFSGDSLQQLTAETSAIDLLMASDSIVGIHAKRSRLPAAQRDRVVIVPTAPLIRQALSPL